MVLFFLSNFFVLFFMIRWESFGILQIGSRWNYHKQQIFSLVKLFKKQCTKFFPILCKIWGHSKFFKFYNFKLYFILKNQDPNETKTFKIFLPVEAPDNLISVTILKNALISDLIGLACYKFECENIINKLKFVFKFWVFVFIFL